jgi:uroporphyrinogen decarboxylase
MTEKCEGRLKAHLGREDLTEFMDVHFASIEPGLGDWEPIGSDKVRDPYRVVWDRSVDKDIGTPCDWPIHSRQDLAGYRWPDTERPEGYAQAREFLRANGDRFRVYAIGFSLFERAWTMYGMENLLMDMVEEPSFVEDFMDAIVAHNLKQIGHALELDIDAMYFGDDYGMQQGLIMGHSHWQRFIKPRLAQMFAPVVRAGKFVSMHSCGQVSPLFDELAEIGLNMFNPFQPEVMDVFSLLKQYHGKLAFHGGLGVQKLLPFGTPQEVREATTRLIEAGRPGGYVLSPSHQVPADTPPQNLVAMMEVLKSQPGYR